MIRKIIEDIKGRLKEVVKRNPYQAILFSGGLDTSILAYLNPEPICITVGLGKDVEDIYYSKWLVESIKIRHILRDVDVREALRSVPDVIRILKSFDPALPNDLVVYFGLKKASELGIDRVATGDGSDELFAGYSYMKEIDDLESYIQRISQNMRFSSNSIGNFFGIKIIQPFIDKEVLDLALRIPSYLKIKKENGKFIGKWILRKAFEELLPKGIIWQSKRPLEDGSGMSKLRGIIESMIKDKEFEEKKRVYPIRFISKEHLFYYEIYRKVVGEIPKPQEGQKECFGCGTGVDKEIFHCKICGYVFKYEECLYPSFGNKIEV